MKSARGSAHFSVTGELHNLKVEELSKTFGKKAVDRISFRWIGPECLVDRYQRSRENDDDSNDSQHHERLLAEWNGKPIAGDHELRICPGRVFTQDRGTQPTDLFRSIEGHEPRRCERSTLVDGAARRFRMRICLRKGFRNQQKYNFWPL